MASRITTYRIRVMGPELPEPASQADIDAFDRRNEEALKNIDLGKVKYEVDMKLPSGYYCTIED